MDGTIHRTTQSLLRLSTYQAQSSLEQKKIESETKKWAPGKVHCMGHSPSSSVLRVLTARSADPILIETPRRAIPVNMVDVVLRNVAMVHSSSPSMRRALSFDAEAEKSRTDLEMTSNHMGKKHDFCRFFTFPSAAFVENHGNGSTRIECKYERVRGRLLRE